MKAPEYKPGDAIRWRHFHLDGRVTLRSGTVIDRAPRVLEGEISRGRHLVPDVSPAQHMNWWVRPDHGEPTDIYEIIAVGWASRDVYAHGWFRTDIWGDQAAWKGDLFSSDEPRSPLGMLAHQAALDAVNNRERNGS